MKESSFNAQKIVIYAENTREIYFSFLAPLRQQLTRRLVSGKDVDLEHLAECSTMKKIVCECVKLFKKYGESVPTTTERKEASTEIANLLIEQAMDEAQEMMHETM